MSPGLRVVAASKTHKKDLNAKLGNPKVCREEHFIRNTMDKEHKYFGNHSKERGFNRVVMSQGFRVGVSIKMEEDDFNAKRDQASMRPCIVTPSLKAGNINADIHSIAKDSNGKDNSPQFLVGTEPSSLGTRQIGLGFKMATSKIQAIKASTARVQGNDTSKVIAKSIGEEKSVDRVVKRSLTIAGVTSSAADSTTSKEMKICKEKKPDHSYISIISKAILSSPEQRLVLSEIYEFTERNYPYFQQKGPGWRNSIRHNLSLNDCFIKAGRSPDGKGHFWAINPLNYDDFRKGDFRRRRTQRRAKKPVERTSHEQGHIERNLPSPIKNQHEKIFKQQRRKTIPIVRPLYRFDLQSPLIPIPRRHSLPPADIPLVAEPQNSPTNCNIHNRGGAKPRKFDMESLLRPEEPKHGHVEPCFECSALGLHKAHATHEAPPYEPRKSHGQQLFTCLQFATPPCSCSLPKVIAANGHRCSCFASSRSSS
eukprot:Seg1568.3 transcript_id=Seg1568.3/GoldUCD/mRNA.D3Y31 product="Fork head domain-containing protein FD3" protein_id=Seg1568.3/GoldUCD/D3Y31